MIGMFPLLLIIILFYAVLALGGDIFLGSADQAFDMVAFLAMPSLQVEMHPGIHWVLTRGDVMLLVGLAFLFMEVIASTRSDKRTIVNHGLSMAVFVAALLAFVLSPPFATSTFFFLMVLALIDVVAGFIITIRVARRDIGFGGDIPGL